MEFTRPEVTVDIVIPARNEEDAIGRCLESLAGQQGISFQITVVDDGSSDRTRAIAESFPGVRVLSAQEPPPGVMGKCNAVITGASGSKATWLLFTDADTVHYPGSLAAAVKEAEDRGVDLLSFSPEQEAVSWAEMALMPVVFAELVRIYPPERVNDPADPTVAANGQYILVRRSVYERLGGHQAVSTKLLEDVELARLLKVSHHKIWFRHGAGMVKTRMYRSFRALCEGWTKNLVLLFRHPLILAMIRALEFVLITGLMIPGLWMLAAGHHIQGAAGSVLLSLVLYGNFLLHIRRAHFPWRANLMAILGLPFFSSLLVRSWLHSYVLGAVTWKGRKYRQIAPAAARDSSIERESRLKS